MMEYSVSEHMHWRSSYHPEDPDLISTVDRYAPSTEIRFIVLKAFLINSLQN